MDFFQRYVLIRELGRGGTGMVYSAYDQVLHRFAAIKGVWLGTDADQRARTVREARNAAALSHQNIVVLYDMKALEKWTVLVMELLTGGTLHQRMLRSVPLKTAIQYVRALLQALGHAHSRNVLHRDLKPSNVMFTQYGQLKIVDFGLAKSAFDLTITKTDQIVGTPAYLAPEQLRNEKAFRPTDLYAVAVIAYELLTGVKPFESSSLYTLMHSIAHEPAAPPISLNRAVPEAISQVVMRALEKDPNKRFQTAAEFELALDLAVSGDLKPEICCHVS